MPGNKLLMKYLGLVSLLLLLGVAAGGTATAELTASQQVPHSAAIGETVMATIVLIYNGHNATQAIVTPGLPAGLVSDMPGSQTAELYPGTPASISYPFRAEQRGTYMVVSDIAYAEEGTWRDLRLEAPFTAVGNDLPQPAPGQQPQPQHVPGVTGPEATEPGAPGSGGDQPGTTEPGMPGPVGSEPGVGGPGGNVPDGNEPGGPGPGGNGPEGAGTGASAPEGVAPGGGAPESPPPGGNQSPPA